LKLISNSELVVIIIPHHLEVFQIAAQRDPVADPLPGFQAEYGRLRLFGKRVCLGALSNLLGIGTKRLRRLRSAASAGEECPLDGRLRKARPDYPRARLRGMSEKRALIFDFLTEMYIKNAEPAPECSSDAPRAVRFRNACRRGKRPRREQKKDLAESWDAETAKSLRLLPAGTYTDYLKLFKAKNPEVTVSFKLFTRVSQHQSHRGDRFVFLWLSPHEVKMKFATTLCAKLLPR